VLWSPTLAASARRSLEKSTLGCPTKTPPTLFGGFAQKTVSVGTFGEPQTNLHTHNAPTIQGTSGGLLVPFADGPQGFAGIHVGGAGEISLNFAIQSTNINLAISYCDAIATHTNEYRLMNRDRLKDYVDGVTEQLSPPRQSQIHHLVLTSFWDAKALPDILVCIKQNYVVPEYDDFSRQKEDPGWLTNRLRKKEPIDG